MNKRTHYLAHWRAAIAALLCVATLTACVDSQGRRAGNMRFRQQAQIPGTVVGAGLGFLIARLLGLNERGTLALTGLGAYGGNRIGARYGESLDRKYDRNRARDARAESRINSASRCIAVARTTNANLRRSLAQLRGSSSVANEERARESRRAGERALDRLQSEMVVVEQESARARNLNLTAEHRALSDKHAAMKDQNDMLESTVRQLRAQETRLSGR